MVNIIKILIILVPIFFLSVSSYSQQVSNEWDYPVKPGTEKWLKMDYQEKVFIDQPPEDILSKMETDILLWYCLNYPFNKDILLFNNPDDGFTKVFAGSRPWNEFIKRDDAFYCFKKVYEKLSLEEISRIEEIKVRNRERFNIFFLEKIASNTSFLEYLSDNQIKEMASTILNGHISKSDYPGDYYGFVYNSSLSVLCKLLNITSISVKCVDDFNMATDYGRNRNNAIEEEIIDDIQKYIKQ